MHYTQNRDYKWLSGNDIGIENWLMPVQKYTEHVVITWGYICLPVTDDSLKVK